MKKVVLIANRLNALRGFEQLEGVEIIKVYVLKDSLLDKQIANMKMSKSTQIDTFTIKDKARLISEIKSLEFDLLVSNGCPFILPVSDMKKAGQLYMNIHPTLLPDLKGKTPLNGVFMTHRKFIGATMHYIDDDIDTGKIISQKKVELTPDIDQGLVYKISFDLEEEVFVDGMKILQQNNYVYAGSEQKGPGSYFNRTDELQTIDIFKDTTDIIIDKVKSFGIRGQGTRLTLEKNSYNIYLAEKIINDYLIDRYATSKAGEILFVYDNKVLIKTIDGIIKLIDYDVI